MLKYIGLILLIVCSTTIGFYLSFKVSNRVKQLELILLMLDKLKTYIRYSHTRVYDIITELNINFQRLSFLSQVQLELKKQTPFPVAWCLGIDDTAKMMNFAIEDVSALKQLAEIIGASDADGQISGVELVENLIKQNLLVARDDNMKKAKLYRSLGLLLGIFVALLFI